MAVGVQVTPYSKTGGSTGAGLSGKTHYILTDQLGESDYVGVRAKLTFNQTTDWLTDNLAGYRMEAVNGVGITWSTGGEIQLDAQRRFSHATGSMTVGAYDDIVLASASTAAVTVTLPDGTAGYRQITVKKTDGSTNGVAVIGHSTADTIDGSSSAAITTQNSAITVINNTSSSPMNWSIVASL